MARARNIKPGFFKNEQLGIAGIEASYVFAGLWCQADCEGIIEYRPLRLKIEIAPYWDIDIASSIQTLCDSGFLRKYSVQGVECLQIVNFKKHQNPHKNEMPSDVPRPEDAASDCSVSTHEKTGAVPNQHQSAPADSLLPITDSLLLIPDPPIPIGDKSPKKKNGAKRCPPDWEPSEELINGLWQQPKFHHLSKQDFLDEAAAMKDWQYKDSKVDWDACYRTWMRNHVARNSASKGLSVEQRRVQNIKKAMQEFVNE